MQNLRPYIINNLTNYDAVIADKEDPRRARLVNMRNFVGTRYNLYSANFTPQNLHLINLHVYTPEEREDLLHCYSSPTIPFSELVNNIKMNQDEHLQGTCQYCGINSDSTIDHYLPEGNYPDFCIYPPNLIPCCPECNSNKHTFFYNEVLGSREIVNLYIDQLPQVQFLFMELTYVNEVPICAFSIDNRNHIEPALYTIIERHFFRLKLLSRFKKKFAKEYRVILKSFKGKPRFIGNQTLIVDTLLDDADTLYLEHGFNYWRRIIRISLANSDEFLVLAST